MKTTLKAAAPALALALLAGACDNSGLTDINKDPNNPEFVSAPSILPQAEQSVVRPGSRCPRCGYVTSRPAENAPSGGAR